MKYFKIQYGYNEADYMPITEDELPKALAIFIDGSDKAIFRNGAIRGQDIMRIVPDWHTAKGWNKGYKMGPEDYSEIKPLENSYNQTYNQAKLIAEIAIRENKPELLTKPLEEAKKLLPDNPIRAWIN